AVRGRRPGPLDEGSRRRSSGNSADQRRAQGEARRILTCAGSSWPGITRRKTRVTALLIWQPTLSAEKCCAKKDGPPGQARGDAAWMGQELNQFTQTSRQRAVSSHLPTHLALRRRSRLGRKAQPSRGLERLGVEGADLDRATHIERHRDAVLGHRRG